MSSNLTKPFLTGFYNRKVYLIFGGTGSLGKTLCKRLKGEQVYVFSRDEAKHHRLSMELESPPASIIGDIRNYESVLKAIRDVRPTHIINAAAMKQVPICEDFPFEAVQTNIIGTQNIVKAVETLYPIPENSDEHYYFNLNPLKVLSVSTDKACKPVNAYGMTKALQERIHMNARANAVFNCVRYGNVLESTGSVIPVFKKLISENRDLSITDVNMTRFLLSLDEAVDLIFKALDDLQSRKIFIPKVKSAKMTDLANAMINKSGKKIYWNITGIRPGEKIHEILVSEEETSRTEDCGDHYVIYSPILASVMSKSIGIQKEYSSADYLMNEEELVKFLESHGAI